MKSAIKFDNGEAGYQYTDDVTGELTGVEILRTAEGEPCSQVFDRHSDVRAKVFGLSDLRAHGPWKLA
jgi:hypothetical protein